MKIKKKQQSGREGAGGSGWGGGWGWVRVDLNEELKFL